jgi:PHYB activation tagged suppressor 1
LPTKKNWQSWKLDREVRRSLTRLIARRSDEAEAEKAGDDGDFRDLLGAMINAGDRKTRAPSPTAAIPVEEMLEECKTFFFAGKQTTTNLLTWAAVLLAMHPDWQKRARREVLDVCGADELPSKEHLPKLKTVSPSHSSDRCGRFFEFSPMGIPVISAADIQCPSCSSCGSSA